MQVENYTHIATGTAISKKEAQTKAAWDFVDFLLKEGQVKESELPPRNPTTVSGYPTATQWHDYSNLWNALA